MQPAKSAMMFVGDDAVRHADDNDDVNDDNDDDDDVVDDVDDVDDDNFELP